MKKLLIVLFVLCSCAGLSAKMRYQGEANLGFGLGVGDNKLSKFTASTIHGLRVNKYIFLGAGIGFDATSTEFKPQLDLLGDLIDLGKPTVIPIFVNIKGYIPLNCKWSLFLGMSAGYGSYGDEDAERFTMEGSSETWLFGYRAKGGVYYSPEFGCTYKFSKKLGLNFAIGYQAQVFNYEFSLGPIGSVDQTTFDKTAGSLIAKVGLTW